MLLCVGEGVGEIYSNTVRWNVNHYKDFAEQFVTAADMHGFSYSKHISKNSSYKIKIVSQDMYKRQSTVYNEKKEKNPQQTGNNLNSHQ